MIATDDARQLITELERASRRTRPFVIAGMLAIIAGFVTLSLFLNHQRQAAERRAEEQTQKVVELTTTIAQAQLLAAEPNLDRGRLLRVLGVAVTQVNSLEATVAQALSDPAAPDDDAGGDAPPTPSAAASNAATSASSGSETEPAVIRLFIQIPSADRLEEARSIARGMRDARIGRSRVIVPEIEVVPGNYRDSVRCLKPVDCRRLDQVVAFVSNHIAGRTFSGIDLSSRFGNTNVAGGTYEIWLAPGGIEPNTP